MFQTAAARLAVATLAAAAASMALVPAAGAVSSSVRSACMSDYFAYCSGHAVGSASLRQCMRSNGPKLSKSCVNALIGAGEVSAATVAKKRSASAN